MRRVENHKLVGIPIGVLLDGERIIDTRPCENSKHCLERYVNFPICSGKRGFTLSGRVVCGFERAPNDMLRGRWVQ